MLTQDDNKQLAFDAQTVLCQCQGQAIDFVRHSATNSNVDFQTKVKMTKVGRVVPPVVEQPPCSQTAASFGRQMAALLVHWDSDQHRTPQCLTIRPTVYMSKEPPIQSKLVVIKIP